MKNGLYIDIRPTLLPYFIMIDGSRTRWSMTIEAAVNDSNLIHNSRYTSNYEWLKLLYEFNSIQEFKERYPEEFI